MFAAPRAAPWLRARSRGIRTATALERFGRPARVVLETGRMANWLHRGLVARDLPAVYVDARQAHAVLSQMPNNTAALMN